MAGISSYVANSCGLTGSTIPGSTIPASAGQFTDNQNVVRILTVGSAKGCLQDVALQIFALCMSRSIHIIWRNCPYIGGHLALFFFKLIFYSWGVCLFLQMSAYSFHLPFFHIFPTSRWL